MVYRMEYSLFFILNICIAFICFMQSRLFLEFLEFFYISNFNTIIFMNKIFRAQSCIKGK